MRLARLLWDWMDDPFYRLQNEQAAATDPFHWRLAAWTGLVLSTVLVLLGMLDTGALQPVGWYALLCMAVAHLASRQPRLYAHWRPPICLGVWLHQGWTLTRLALLSSTHVSMHSAPTWLVLLLVGLWNGSLFMLCATLRAPLLLWWNSLALPLAAAIPAWCSGAVCQQGLLQGPGAAVAIVRLYRVLSWTHIVTAFPGAADPALGASRSVLHCCWMVNTWAVVTGTVLLPWVWAWRRERLARRRFAWRRLLEAVGEVDQPPHEEVADQVAGPIEEAEAEPSDNMQPPALGPAMAREAWEPWRLADDCRPDWAWALDFYLLSCAAWAALLLYATARGF